jgi:hypothetical protein
VAVSNGNGRFGQAELKLRTRAPLATSYSRMSLLPMLATYNSDPFADRWIPESSDAESPSARTPVGCPDESK